jgi:predicted phosphodiesterase
MIVSIISDTHAKHKQVTQDLIGGDLLLHGGDFMTSGYSKYEAEEFFKWFDSIDNYEYKTFIAGNHDRVMQDIPDEMQGILTAYKTIDYLQDDECVMYYDGPNGDRPEDNIRIYGSPWQPEFYNWAFNLPRNGPGLASKWEAIPDNTDILITHGPPWGILDDTEGRRGQHLGCELLRERVNAIRPKIHIFGHIHSGHGYYYDGHTHFFNASVLNERYSYSHLPFNFSWNPVTNSIGWL